MTRLRILLSRIVALFRRRRLEHEMETEIKSHLAMQADDNIRSGMTAEEAAPAARRSFGGISQIKERYREIRGIPSIETILQDLRHGRRMLARNPGFTFVAVISLAIGIGANTATFSLADGALLRPLPVRNPSEIVVVGSRDVASTGGSEVLRSSYRDYVDLRDRSRSFDGLTASTRTPVRFVAEPGAPPEVRTAVLVSGNYFRVMGVEPDLGRGFLPEEDQVPSRDAVMVLSYGFWRRQFGGNPGILGRHVRLNEIDFTIIGVAPERFTGTEQFLPPEFYVPIMMWPALVPTEPSPLEHRDLRSLVLKGRLADGISQAQASAELASIGDSLAQVYPDTNSNQRIFLRTEFEDRIETFGFEGIAMMMTLGAAVLLVACFNVAGLLTSRAPARASEIALRLSIGARRRRVIRQLFTENLLVGVIGGTLGLVVGYVGVLLWRQISAGPNVTLSFDLDGRALAVSIGITIASVFLFGLAPAVQTTHRTISGVLKSAGRGASASRQWGRSVLVVGQIAVSLTLLSVAGFMYASFLRQLAAGPGYRTDHLLTVNFAPSLSGYSEAQIQRFYDQIVERSRELPGVKSAGITSYIPMSGTATGNTSIQPEGYQFPAGTEAARVPTSYVNPDFFDVMGISILKGRAFAERDSAESPRVAVVNQHLASRYWGNQSPVGKRFRLNDSPDSWVEIVGVTSTGRYYAISEPPQEFLYLPYAQNPRTQMTLLVQSEDEPVALAAPLRRLVGELAPDLAVVSTEAMENLYYDRAVANFLVVMRAIAAMGMMGVTLAFAGLYGLVAYSVGRRTREIGIRMAIGASQGTVLRMVLGQGLSLAVIGLLVGLALTIGADRAMVAMFPGGGGNERGPGEYVIWTIALLAITALAAYLPARRAAHIAPTEALRYE